MEDPPYSIATAEMTRECPDPFPAPTATKSQNARKTPQNRSDKEKIACLSRTRRGFLVQHGHLVGERHAGERALQRRQLALAGVGHHEPRLRAAPGALADKRQAHLLAALALGPHDDGRRWPYRPSPPTRPSSRASSSRVAASSAARRASSIRPASRRAAISAPSAMAPSSRPSSRARRQRISVSCS